MSMHLHSSPARQGGNSTAVRQFNERRLLTVLRRLGDSSKGELAAQLNLTQNAVGQIVQSLESQGLIASGGRRMGRRGQPATLLHLDPQGAYSLGVKIGSRAVSALLIDFTGGVLKSRRAECLFPSPQQAMALALRAVAELRSTLPRGRRNRLLGVGIATPSALDRWPGDHGWRTYDIAGEFGAATGIPVLVEKDCIAAAVAELFHGHGRELDDFASVYINSAIGGGIVLDGDYRRGISGNAGDLGLIPVPRSHLRGAPDMQGGASVLLDRASGTALIRHLHANGVGVARAVDLHGVLRSHAKVVAEWLDDCAESLVVPLLSMTALLEVRAIVLDGNLPRDVIGALLDRLRPLLAAAMPEPRHPPELRLGSSGKHAVALGAALLPLHSRHAQARDGAPKPQF